MDSRKPRGHTPNPAAVALERAAAARYWAGRDLKAIYGFVTGIGIRARLQQTTRVRP